MSMKIVSLEKIFLELTAGDGELPEDDEATEEGALLLEQDYNEQQEESEHDGDL